MNRYSSRIRRRRRNRRLAAYGCAALIMAVSVSGVWWSVMKKNKGGVHDAYAAGIEMTPYREESENTTLPTEVVSLNGVVITGLTRQQA